MTYYMVKPIPASSFDPNANSVNQSANAIFVSPKHGKDRIPLPARAVDYLADLNPGRAWNMVGTQSNVKVVMTPTTGLFNQSERNWFDVRGVGKMETLSWGYNVVRTPSILSPTQYDGYVELDTVNIEDYLGSSFWESPWNHQMITCMNRNEQQRRYGMGWTLFTVMYSRTPLYQRASELEEFPELPVTLTVNRESRLRIWPSKKAQASGSIAPRKNITIYDYAPRGSEIWGVTYDNKFILLREVDAFGVQHYTNWKMFTQPVLPPVGVWELSPKALAQTVYGWTQTV